MEYKASLHPIIEAVTHKGPSLYSLHGWELMITCSTEEGLCIETSVFQGQHYIPPSVRTAVISPRPSSIHSSLPISLRLDEEGYRVILYYAGHSKDLGAVRFNAVLEEFAWAAEQWWHHLDEKSRGDLLHIRVKS